jgi:hypothetical protein
MQIGLYCSELIGIWIPKHTAGKDLEAGGIQMLYKKIQVELIVIADEAAAVAAELNATLDRLEESHTLFGGGFETVAFEHTGIRRRSALAHTMAAGEKVAVAVRAAREGVNIALRAVI